MSNLTTPIFLGRMLLQIYLLVIFYWLCQKLLSIKSKFVLDNSPLLLHYKIEKQKHWAKP